MPSPAKPALVQKKLDQSKKQQQNDGSSVYQQDLHWYLRMVEEVVIKTLKHFDIESQRDEINTGTTFYDFFACWSNRSSTHSHPSIPLGSFIWILWF